MSCRNIDIKDEFIKELKEELKLRQAELEGSRYLIKRIGATLRKAWEEHREGEVYPGLNDEDIGWAFDSLVTQKALELACQKIAEESEGFCPVSQDLAGNDFKPECPCGGFVGNHVMVDDKSCWYDYFLQKAKEAANEASD